jgi:hypothetical protein
MTTPLTVTLDITPEEKQQIEVLVNRSGYKTINEYVLALVQSELDAQDENPVQGFREGWRDAMTGNTFPLDTLWDDNPQ